MSPHQVLAVDRMNSFVLYNIYHKCAANHKGKYAFTQIILLYGINEYDESS